MILSKGIRIMWILMKGRRFMCWRRWRRLVLGVRRRGVWRVLGMCIMFGRSKNKNRKKLNRIKN